MRIQFVLSILLTSSVFAQTTGTTILSEPFVLKPKRDFAGPRVTVEDPVVVSGGSVVVSAREVSVKGVASAAGGIKSVNVNGMTTIPSASGGFRVQIPLHPSSNQIVVKAEDNAGNVGEFSFTAQSDLKPPVIDVIQPQMKDMRGIRNVVVETGVLIARVYDECMLKTVTVNGSEVQVGPDSLITVQLTPGGGTDTMKIVAVDVADHSSEVVVPVKHKPLRAQPGFLSGKNYALVVGIDKYRGIWPKLKNAVNDARTVAQILWSKFQFSTVDTLIDDRATRDNVLGKIESLGRSLRADDNLLIYFSGHGLKEPPYNKGYWVPVDAIDHSIGRYISNRDIQDYLQAMAPRHVLLITDACFAADIFKGATLRYDFEDNDNYYKHVAGFKSRKALTSGGDEPVMDGGIGGHSIFASYLIKALEDINKPYFSAWEVYDRLRIGVANNSEQLPEFGAIKSCGDEGGEFLFVRR